MPPAFLERFFSSNSRWAAAVSSSEPEFFNKLAEKQEPKVLWLGCADSRVPESVVLGVRPGELFVHRNIANQFHPSDDSALSVLTYAVETVGVEHVVVAGHTQCGGVKGALAIASSHDATPSNEGASTPLGRWLTPLITMAKEKNLTEASGDSGVSELTKASVRKQVENIASSSIIQNAWAQGKPITIHGWIFHLEDGKLEDLGIDVFPPNQSIKNAEVE